MSEATEPITTPDGDQVVGDPPAETTPAEPTPAPAEQPSEGDRDPEGKGRTLYQVLHAPVGDDGSIAEGYRPTARVWAHNHTRAKELAWADARNLLEPLASDCGVKLRVVPASSWPKEANVEASTIEQPAPVLTIR